MEQLFQEIYNYGLICMKYLNVLYDAFKIETDLHEKFNKDFFQRHQKPMKNLRLLDIIKINHHTL